MRADARQNRQRILAAAEAVFGESGASGSTEEVARRAGVGVGTVFRHFPTKDELLAAALVEHFAELTALARAAAAEADATTALRRVVRAMIESGAVKVRLLELVRAGGEPPESVRAASGELRDAVAMIVRRAQRAGAVRRSVGVDEVYLLIRGLAQASASQPTSGRTLGRAVDVVLDGLAAR